MDTILSLLDAGLQTSNLDNMMKNLGNRSPSLGMAEIAKVTDCMRWAVPNKVHTSISVGEVKPTNSQNAYIQNAHIQNAHIQNAYIQNAHIAMDFKYCLMRGFPLHEHTNKCNCENLSTRV